MASPPGSSGAGPGSFAGTACSSPSAEKAGARRPTVDWGGGLFDCLFFSRRGTASRFLVEVGDVRWALRIDGPGSRRSIANGRREDRFRNDGVGEFATRRI